MLETCISLEPGVFECDEFLVADRPVWVLGKSYNARSDLDLIKADVRSLLWFTYRRNFAPIGGTGPVTDQGWGCMLRCGQMLLGNTLVRLHLGREWTWDFADSNGTYMQILQKFSDKKHHLYSIHQIAQMGVSEGKTVGQWFGPNTVAHVLKKLTVYDDWSQLVIYVGMDNTVIIEDVKLLCKSVVKRQVSTEIPVVSSPTAKASPGRHWKPLLLVVPLRLGLASLNSVYEGSLKQYFMLKQSVGIIGGRPNHALYFVGFIGDELIYLDPHECQQAVDLDVPKTLIDDRSYHCPILHHMPLSSIDPSLALAFFCNTELEFDDLCKAFRNSLLKASTPPMFELLDKHPKHIPKFEPYCFEDVPKTEDQFDFRLAPRPCLSCWTSTQSTSPSSSPTASRMSPKLRISLIS